MKRQALFIIIFAVLTAMFADAQTIQKGVVYRYNGKKPRTPIGQVYLKPNTSANGVLSNENGVFKLSLNNLSMGSRIGKVRVTKQGMMVFNQQAVDEWSVRKDPLRLILCDANEFQRQKKHLISIGERRAKEKYNKELAKLNKINENQSIKIEEYYDKLDSLEKEYQNALKHMDEYADLFARIDESEVDTLAQRAIELFNKGELEESLRLFEKGNYMSKLKEALRVKAQAQDMRQLADSAEMLADKDIETYTRSLKAQISTYKLNNDWEKAGALLKELADTLGSYEAMEEYANFCYKQYDFTEAEKYYQKCKELLTNKESCIKSSDLAFVYKNLGIIYDKNQQYKESETMFKEALKIYELLANKTPGTYKNEIALTQMNLADLYSDMRRFVESEEMYNAALRSYDNIIEKYPEVYKADESQIATAQMNLANLYIQTRQYDKSETLLKTALTTFERLAKENSKAYETSVLDVQFHLATIYAISNNYREGHKLNSILLPKLKENLINKSTYFLEVYTHLIISQSYYSILLGLFKDGEQYALEALTVAPSFNIINTNLAAALLFQGKVEEAEKTTVNIKPS